MLGHGQVGFRFNKVFKIWFAQCTNFAFDPTIKYDCLVWRHFARQSFFLAEKALSKSERSCCKARIVTFLLCKQWGIVARHFLWETCFQIVFVRLIFQFLKLMYICNSAEFIQCFFKCWIHFPLTSFVLSFRNFCTRHQILLQPKAQLFQTLQCF